MPAHTARCWVPGCVNNNVFERLSSNVKLFKFPSGDLARCRKWVKAIGSKELLSCSAFKLRNKTVCEAHFRDYEIRVNACKTTLVTSAVPSQFPPGVLPLSDEVVEQWPLQKENQSGGQLDSSVFHLRQPLAVSTPGPLKEREANVAHQASAAGVQAGSSPQVASFEPESGSKEPAKRHLEDDSMSHFSNSQLDHSYTAFSKPALKRRSDGDVGACSPRKRTISTSVPLTATTPVTSRSRSLSHSSLGACDDVLAAPLGTEDALQEVHAGSVSMPIRKRTWRDVAPQKLPKTNRTGASLRMTLGKRLTVRGMLNQRGIDGPVTPRKTILCKELRQVLKTLKNIRSKRDDYRDQLNAICDAKNLDAILRGILSPQLLCWVNGEIRNKRFKDPRSRRWTKEDKIRALSLYKKSPRSYNILCKLLVIPHPSTLTRLLAEFDLQPGLNEDILKLLKEEADRRKSTPRNLHVSLIWDEMHLKKRLFYNTRTGRVEGYVDRGRGIRLGIVADKAMVFMIQGLALKYKMPVAFYFEKDGMKADVLTETIKEVIDAVEGAGFIVSTTACDQAPANQTAVNNLLGFDPKRKGKSQTEPPTFFIRNGHKIFPLFDIPHLIKSIRNNFMSSIFFEMRSPPPAQTQNCDDEWETDDEDEDQPRPTATKLKAKWANIVKLYHDQKSRRYSVVGLTKAMVYPKGMGKMSVKNCFKVFSHSCASAVSLVGESHNTSVAIIGSKETAKVLWRMNHIIDWTNGPANPGDVKKHRKDLGINSRHVQEWDEIIEDAKSMMFQKWDKKARKLRNVRPPCVTGLERTVRGMKDLWIHLSQGLPDTSKFKFLHLRQLNQDALENFFSMIRQHGVTNDSPTCTLFVAAYKTAIVNRLAMKMSRGSNCENDESTLMNDLHSLFFPTTSEESESAEPEQSGSAHVLTSQESLGYSLGKDETEDNIDELLLLAFSDNLTGELAVPRTTTDPHSSPVLLHIPDNISPRDALTEEVLTLSVVEYSGDVYVSGYIGKKMLDVSSGTCRICKSSIESETIQKWHRFIELKEYDNMKVQMIGDREVLVTENGKTFKYRLIYPSFNLVQALVAGSKAFEREILGTVNGKQIGENRLHSPNLLSLVQTLVMTHVDMKWLDCPDHGEKTNNEFFRVFVSLLIRSECKRINKFILQAEEKAKEMKAARIKAAAAAKAAPNIEAIENACRGAVTDMVRQVCVDLGEEKPVVVSRKGKGRKRKGCGNSK